LVEGNGAGITNIIEGAELAAVAAAFTGFSGSYRIFRKSHQ